MFEFIGDPSDLTANGHRGMVRAFPREYKMLDDPEYGHAIFSAIEPVDRVVVIASGGGGSGPLVAGYVGEGLADAGITGDVHAAPSAYDIYKAGLCLDRGHGILLVYNNFMGDRLNNDMAAELLGYDGIKVRRIEVHDNMASASSAERQERGGFCGMLLLLKIANACAQRHADLDEVYRIAEKADRRLSSISVIVDPNKKILEYGKGFSGEAPLYTSGLLSPDEVAKHVIDDLLADLRPKADEKLIVMVDRLRMSSYFESFVMVDAIGRYLDQKGLPHRITAGSYLCINREHGFYFTMLAADKELCTYLDHDCKTDSFAI